MLGWSRSSKASIEDPDPLPTCINVELFQILWYWTAGHMTAFFIAFHWLKCRPLVSWVKCLIPSLYYGHWVAIIVGGEGGYVSWFMCISICTPYAIRFTWVASASIHILGSQCLSGHVDSQPLIHFRYLWVKPRLHRCLYQDIQFPGVISRLLDHDFPVVQLLGKLVLLSDCQLINQSINSSYIALVR